MATILVVDDEPQVVLMIAKALEGEGHTVLVARSGAEAISVWKSRPGEIDLLLTDFEMPDMDGAAVARSLRAAAPELPVILISGGSRALSNLVPRPSQFLPKPFSIGDLAQLTHSMVSASLLPGRPH